MSKLTIKQRRFCDEYLIDLNGTQAAIRAGYSKKTANRIATENLSKPVIKQYIDKRMAEKEDELIAKQDEVLKYLTNAMRRKEDEHQVVTLRTKEERWVKVDDKGTLKKQTVETEEASVVPMPTKVSDSNKAAELLGKRYALWTDKQEISGDLGVTFVDDIGSDPDGD